VAATTAAAADPVVATAGDIACDPQNASFNGGAGTVILCRQQATADLIAGSGAAAVLPLGDNQYWCGGYNAFLQSYDASWGRFKAITHPVVGNHEYLTTGTSSGTAGSTGCNGQNAGAAGYFRYFGAAAGQQGAGWYSYDVGTWHLIALNSNCSDAGGCSADSPQGRWLAADLAAHRGRCTLAYWHIPLFSTGNFASPNSRSFWDQLYAAKADVVLNGHDHNYQRFAPQTPSGAIDEARGIREFLVGTGGANLNGYGSSSGNAEVRDNSTYGILLLTLHPRSYDWRFVPVPGETFSDAGSAGCHDTTAFDQPPPLAVNLGAASRQHALRRHFVSISVRCSRACTITAAGNFVTGRPKRRHRLRSVTRSLPGGMRTKLRLALSRSAQRALRGRRSVPATIVVSPAAGGPSFGTITRRIRLVR
jgi:hypothetical protein